MTQSIRTHYKRPSVVALLIANGVLFVGVAFFGWTFKSVLYVYFIETIIVGFYSLLHIWSADLPKRNSEKGLVEGELIKRVVYTVSFILFYGFFAVFQIVFLSITMPLYANDLVELWPAVIALILSHGFSYGINFIGNEEFRRLRPKDIYTRPFKRFAFPQSGLFLLVFPYMALLGQIGAHIVGIQVFVLLKIYFELKLHIWEHQEFWK